MRLKGERTAVFFKGEKKPLWIFSLLTEESSVASENNVAMAAWLFASPLVSVPKQNIAGQFHGDAELIVDALHPDDTPRALDGDFGELHR